MRTIIRVMAMVMAATLLLADAATVASANGDVTPAQPRVSDERLAQVLPPLGAFPRGSTQTGPTPASGSLLNVCGEAAAGPTPVRAAASSYATPSGNGYFIVIEELRTATAARQRMQRLSQQYRRVCGRGPDAAVDSTRPIVRIGRATNAFTRTRRLSGRVFARDYATFHHTGRFVVVTQVIDLDFVDPPRIVDREVRRVHRTLDRRVDQLTG